MYVFMYVHSYVCMYDVHVCMYVCMYDVYVYMYVGCMCDFLMYA